MFERKIIANPWEGKIDPFKIIGNLYFVGTYQASSHLIDTGKGLILIDTGYSDTLYLVVRSIYELGYKLTDVKYIINTHWHCDHTGGTQQIAGLSGATTMIGRKDMGNAKQYFEPNMLINDGDTLTLGNTTIKFIDTPGHTEGTISLFFDVEEDGKVYRVGMFGGAGTTTLLQGRFEYDACREDYRKSLQRLRQEEVDVFIGNHVWNNDTEAKGEVLQKTGENRFIDKNLWPAFLDFCEKKLEDAISKDILTETETEKKP